MATRAKGVASRVELLAAGITPEQIRQRLSKGSLIPEFRGVYRVGHRAPSVEARYMAAVKACGEGAVLSGPAAAYLYGLIKGPRPIPHVTVSKQRRVKGVVVKRSQQIEATVFKGIPITTVARTLVDLAAVLSLDDLARACHEAEVRYGSAKRGVEDVLAKRQNAPGARNLREVFQGDARVMLSVLERRFLRLLADNGLPLPVTNRRRGRYYVDCRWPHLRLTVELDSYRYHSSRHAWEQDRRRERDARARGDEFRRYTYGDVCEQPALMLKELRTLLGQRDSAVAMQQRSNKVRG